jgi:hypothetical protein
VHIDAFALRVACAPLRARRAVDTCVVEIDAHGERTPRHEVDPSDAPYPLHARAKTDDAYFDRPKRPSFMYENERDGQLHRLVSRERRLANMGCDAGLIHFESDSVDA